MAKWVSERQWEATREEQFFLDMLDENGFKVEQVREWNSKTDYKISKDGVLIEFDFHHIGGGKKQAESVFKSFLSYYELYKKSIELKIIK